MYIYETRFFNYVFKIVFLSKKKKIEFIHFVGSGSKDCNFRISIIENWLCDYNCIKKQNIYQILLEVSTVL